MSKKDFLSELGELAFASRLKRLSERLGRDVSRIYADLDLPFEAKWFGLFKLLSNYSPLSITEAADLLGISHAAVNQLASQLTRRKLIDSVKSKKDDRKRMLKLTQQGKQLAKKMAPLWEEVKRQTESLIGAVDGELMKKIAAIEEQLDQSDMHQRVMAALDITPARKIEILPYRPAYKKHFKIINEEWLSRCFGVEDEDRKQLEDPNGTIIRKGGQILFARVDNRIVGTCALIRHKPNLFELAKMGVTEEARGIGIGKLLAERIIDLARREKTDRLYLLTAPELKPAIALYKKLGFTKTESTPLPEFKYQRCTFAMELDFKKS